jgi:hypothetical protein
LLSYWARCSGERTSRSNCRASLSASGRGRSQDVIVATNPIRLNSPTDQLWHEQGAFNILIERFEHPVLGPVLAQSNGREAALRQLAKALLCGSSIRKMVPSVATSIHDN